jgi:hypothetical protein
MHRWRFRCIADASVQAVADRMVEARSLPLMWRCCCHQKSCHECMCVPAFSANRMTLCACVTQVVPTCRIVSAADENANQGGERDTESDVCFLTLLYVVRLLAPRPLYTNPISVCVSVCVCV